ncbi:MAG: DNA-binding domain-containing protein [Parachlamydiaceae bacterium]|nr:DNA-binding domain-containing protein [Parachlamydiaceae bacterium]
MNRLENIFQDTNKHNENLQSIQNWFGDVIAQPLIDNYIIQPYASNGILLSEEAEKYIIPSPTLKPYQRMQIYNQQYWWRLHNTLHSNFPLLTRLFGRSSFNEKIATPFLMQYPPNHWSLNHLGERLPSWIQDYYQHADQKLVFNAAKLDWAFADSSFAPKYSPLDLKKILEVNPEQLLTYTLHLQPHVHLFMWDYDLLMFRKKMLEKDVDAWIKNAFPKLKNGKNQFFVLYRNIRNNFSWRSIMKGEYLLLQQFQQGKSIEEACEYLESNDQASCEEIENNMERMFQEWTQLEWLYSHHSDT